MVVCHLNYHDKTFVITLLACKIKRKTEGYKLMRGGEYRREWSSTGKMNSQNISGKRGKANTRYYK